MDIEDNKSLNEQGFDLWAKDYDNTVIRNSNKYPFDKYYEGLFMIYNKIMNSKNPKVLDIGFGTATLTERLYNNECDIFGIDFSKEMIKIAQEKMPKSNLYHFDFNYGLPEVLKNTKFDYIISSYAIHHLVDDTKIDFLNNLKTHLSDNGEIIILDIAFNTKEELNKVKNDNIDDWDETEYYIVWELLKNKLQEFNFKQISSCSGMIEYKKNDELNKKRRK